MKTNAQIIFNVRGITDANPAAQAEEILKKESCSEHPRTFSAADLWNIQRQRKTFIIR
jgi:hypothetical protein